MKCRRIFYLAPKSSIVSLVLSLALALLACPAIPFASLAYIKSLLLGILFPNDKW
jgi:hypothetical protein